LFGLKTKDFVILAADQVVINQFWFLKKDQDKSFRLGEKLAMLCVGDGGDADQFAEYIAKNVQLYKMRNGYEMSPKAASSFTRKTIADSLRSSEPYYVHLVIGGYDQHSGPYLTYMDYLGTQFEGPYLMHGYGGYFCYSILDRVYRENFTVEEAVDALKLCLREVKHRFAIDLPTFQAVCIDKDGLRKIDISQA